MAFKLAIIGLGKIAQDQHLPVVARNSNFELAAVVSSREGRSHVDGAPLQLVSDCFMLGRRTDTEPFL